MSSIDDLGYCIATNIVANGHSKVRFMYRETPENDRDSGWRFFSGYESDEYVSDPDASSVYAISTIAQLDPSIAGLLKSPFGSMYERPHDEDEPFLQVHDIDFPEY
jgi:hypothetical protein